MVQEKIRSKGTIEMVAECQVTHNAMMTHWSCYNDAKALHEKNSLRLETIVRRFFYKKCKDNPLMMDLLQSHHLVLEDEKDMEDGTFLQVISRLVFGVHFSGESTRLKISDDAGKMLDEAQITSLVRALGFGVKITIQEGFNYFFLINYDPL